MKIIKFGKYSGGLIRGRVLIEKKIETDIDAALWLTAQVESGGKFGTVMNYDGTGMTAGIHQAIAVYPKALADNNAKNDQGPLWRLLGTMHHSDALANALEWFGYTLNFAEGVLEKGNGDRVSGPAIRKMFCGSPDGIVTDPALTAKWLRIFNGHFSHPDGFAAQEVFGRRALERALDKKLRFSRWHKDAAARELFDPAEFTGSPMSLAMAVYLSHSVNAPGFALKKLSFASEMVKPLHRRVIEVLGNTTFGRWSAGIKNGRYQRTRAAAMKLWPKDLFKKDGMMPKNLEG